MSEGTEATAAPDAGGVLALAAATAFDQLAARRIANGPKGSNFGITRAMLGDYLNRKGPATADELAGITEDLARDLLFRRVWLAMGLDKLPAPVSALLFDIAVRRGTEEAGKLLQAAAKRVEPMALAIDGRIGVQTLTAIDELLKAGKGVALEEQVLAGRTTAVFRLGDGKFFGHDVDFASAVRLAGVLGKSAFTARTGIPLP